MPRNTPILPRSAHLAFPFLMPPRPTPLLCIVWDLSPKHGVFLSFPSSQDTWKFLLQAPATPHGDRGQATPKQSPTQHRAAGVTHSETTQLRIQGLLHTEDVTYASKNSLTYLRKNRSSKCQQGLPPEGCRGSIFHREKCN